jgi:NADPH-dependent ferric siderophore reductase
VDTPSPHFRSVTFTGAALEGFISASFDDHIKFILGASGANPVMRDYTPRRYDAAAGELTIEFALHGDGPAASWAAQAAPGQQATIAGPRGSFVIPVDYEWHVLIGDDTALPAVARRLEELPANVRALVILQVPESDRRSLPSAAQVSLQWVDDDAALLEAARRLELPAGEGYAWCAGEAGAMSALRRVLVEEKGHDRHAIRAAAYWKRGATAHHENLEG